MDIFDLASWKKQEKIGNGVYGKVYLLIQGDRKIAYKSFIYSMKQDAIREIGAYAILKSTQSQMSPEILGFNLENKNIGIAMEFASQTLSDWTRNCSETTRNTFGCRIMDLAFQSLYEIHKCNIIHTDIKPSNIMVWWNESKTDIQKVAIMDFGLSSSQPYQFSYTPNYRAPEIWKGSLSSKESDIWALGLSILEVLISQSFFEEFDTIKLSNDIIQKKEIIDESLSNTLSKKYPEDHITLLKIALSYNPERRSMVWQNFNQLNLRNNQNLCNNQDLSIFKERDWNWLEINEASSEVPGILFEWMWKTCKSVNQGIDTFIQSIDIACRYLVKTKTPRNHWQMIGGTALMIASKWGGNNYIDYAFVRDVTSYSLQEIEDCEKNIIKVLLGLIWIPGLEELVSLLKEMKLKNKKISVWLKEIRPLNPEKWIHSLRLTLNLKKIRIKRIN